MWEWHAADIILVLYTKVPGGEGNTREDVGTSVR